jgi:hypothetical protein
VAEGAVLPDNENLSEAISYKRVQGSGWWNHFVLEFTLTEASEVSIGFVVSIDGSDGPHETGVLRSLKMMKLY